MNTSSQEAARALACVRIAVNAVFLWQSISTSFRHLGQLPVEIMHPPGIMEYIGWKFYDRLMTPACMEGFKWVLVAALLASLVGFWTHVSTKLSLVLVVLYQGILRSFGHVNHDEYVGMYFLLILAFVPCGDRFSLDACLRSTPSLVSDSIAYRYPIYLMQAVMAWCYFSTGILKLRNGGLDYFRPDHLPVLAIQQSLDNLHDTQFRLAFMLPSIRQATPIMLLFVVLWEITFPIGVFWKKTRWIYLSFGLTFHILSVLLMNIGFWNQVGMYAVFVDWTKLRSCLGRLVFVPTVIQKSAQTRISTVSTER
jgi:hypothetical protein